MCAERIKELLDLFYSDRKPDRINMVEVWEEFIKILKEVTVGDLEVVDYFKSIIAGHIGQWPLAMHVLIAAKLVSLDKGENVSCFCCQNIPKEKRENANLSDRGYFLVRLHGVITIDHDLLQPDISK